jgi:hypothetical protein
MYMKEDLPVHCVRVDLRWIGSVGVIEQILDTDAQLQVSYTQCTSQLKLQTPPAS